MGVECRCPPKAAAKLYERTQKGINRGWMCKAHGFPHEWPFKAGFPKSYVRLKGKQEKYVKVQVGPAYFHVVKKRTSSSH